MFEVLAELAVALSFGCFSVFVIYRYILWELGELDGELQEQ